MLSSSSSLSAAFRAITFTSPGADPVLIRALKPADLNEVLLYVVYDSLANTADKWKTPTNSKRAIFHALRTTYSFEGRKYLGLWAGLKALQQYEKKYRQLFQDTGLLYSSFNDMSAIYNQAAKHIHPALYGESIPTVGKSVEAFHEFNGIIIMGPVNCLPFRISEAIVKPMYLQNGKPLLIFETDGTSISPAFLRQVDVHISQVLRDFVSKNS